MTLREAILVGLITLSPTGCAPSLVAEPDFSVNVPGVSTTVDGGQLTVRYEYDLCLVPDLNNKKGAVTITQKVRAPSPSLFQTIVALITTVIGLAFSS